jgi:hypothetical protein
MEEPSRKNSWSARREVSPSLKFINRYSNSIAASHARKNVENVPRFIASVKSPAIATDPAQFSSKALT